MPMPITKGKGKGPERCVIYGPEKIGKSTLAAQFPGVVFIDTEESTKHMDVARTPEPTSWPMLLQIVSALQKDQQGFTTCTLDTADWAERLCISHICGQHGMDGIEGFGYGKGYTYLAEEFGRLLDALKALPMHVVVTAHAQSRKFELPEETGAFDRWELKLQKKTAPLLKEWADMVLFCNYEIFLVTDEKTKSNKAQGGGRVMYTSHHPCWDAGNRHGLPEKLDLDFRGIAHCFPEPQRKQQQPTTGETQAVTSPDGSQTVRGPSVSDSMRKLQQLMQHSGVSAGDLIAAIASKGHFPDDTSLENLPDDYINGMLLPHWDKVVKSIKKEETNV